MFQQEIHSDYPNPITKHQCLLPFFLVLWSLSCTGQETPVAETKSARDAVEYLVFQVEPDRVDEFVRLENEIWTNELMRQDGFISKDIWINESKPGEVSVIIYWKDFESWKNIPKEVTEKLTRQFDDQFGAEDYQIIREVHGQ